jgi:hypothetical protein
MAALRQREWGNLSSAFIKADKFPSAASLQGNELNFMPALAICFQIDSQHLYEVALLIQELSQDGGRADFSENLCASKSLMKIYQMNLISARFISLDSTF